MKFDRRTIDKIRRQDPETVEAVYKSYHKLVKYIIFDIVHDHSDADDLTQEVFIKVFTRIDTYDPTYKFNNWITAVAKNTALDFLRRRMTQPELSDVPAELIEGEEEKNDDSLDIAIRAILSEEEYFIVTHRLYFDFKFREIAEMLDSNASIVSSKYFRAIGKLKKRLRREDFYD